MAVASAIYVCDASGVGDAASGVGDADGQLSTDATPPTEYSVSSQTITRVSSRVPAQEPTRLRVRRAQNPRCVELALVHHVELVPIEPRHSVGIHRHAGLKRLVKDDVVPSVRMARLEAI